MNGFFEGLIHFFSHASFLEGVGFIGLGIFMLFLFFVALFYPIAAALFLGKEIDETLESLPSNYTAQVKRNSIYFGFAISIVGLFTAFLGVLNDYRYPLFYFVIWGALTLGIFYWSDKIYSAYNKVRSWLSSIGAFFKRGDRNDGGTT